LVNFILKKKTPSPIISELNGVILKDLISQAILRLVLFLPLQSLFLTFKSQLKPPSKTPLVRLKNPQ